MLNEKEFYKVFSTMSKVVFFSFCLVISLIIGIWATVIYVGVHTYNTMSDPSFHGVKQEIEKMWCGEDGCLKENSKE